MRSKSEILPFDPRLQIAISKFQPFFKFVNTNGSKLGEQRMSWRLLTFLTSFFYSHFSFSVRCLLIDQGYLEVGSDSELYDVLWTGKHIKKSQLQVNTEMQHVYSGLTLFVLPSGFQSVSKDQSLSAHVRNYAEGSIVQECE